MRAATLPDALEAAAQAYPDVPITFPSTAERCTLRELVLSSREMAFSLVSAGVGAGDRVGVLSRNNPDFLTAVFAVTSAGAAACPMPLPSSARDLAGYGARLVATTSVAGIRHVVAGAGLPGMMRRIADVLPEVTFLPAAELTGPAPRSAGLPRIDADQLAVVQFTSGSTALPKGVRLTHANVLHGTAAIGEGIGLGPGDHGATWLPLFHDMGLFGTLSAALIGVPMTVWSPASFVKDPGGWLRDFLGRGVTVCAAPNFGYDSLVTAVPQDQARRLDMSGWRVAFNGAEPIPPTSVQRFLDHFATAGFAPTAMLPVYGMAEATLAVTFPPLGRAPITTWVDRERLATGGVADELTRGDPRARGLVALGSPVRGMRLRIGDGHGAAQPDGRVGEIEIRGDAVTAGYLTTGTTGTDPVSEDGWLRTGDLGFLRAGELYVTGRCKEMIVVRGVNYYPEDAESVIRDAPGIYRRRCIAIADIEPDGVENITILGETALQTAADRARLAADLRSAVSAALGLREVNVQLVSPDALPRTTSGKFRRIAARELRGGRALQW